MEPLTVLTVQTVYMYIDIVACTVYMYTAIENRALERRASRCWCSMGNPLPVREDAGRSSAIGSV